MTDDRIDTGTGGVTPVERIRRATEMVQTTARNVRESRDVDLLEVQRQNIANLQHALRLTIDQRDRAVRALAVTIDAWDIPTTAEHLLNEPWAQEVLDE